MTAITDTIPVSDLEEMFNLELPCGGNTSPRKRPCPYNAAAEYICTHVCGEGRDPEQYKCQACYVEWLTVGTFVTCQKCGEQFLARLLYRRI